MNSDNVEIIKGFLNGLKPDPLLTVSQWAEKNRIMGFTSPAPGPWRNDRTPYSVEIMDRLGVTDPCQEIVFMKGAQIGASEIGFNWMGYIIDINPSSTMLVQPTTDTVKRNTKIRIDPMIEDSPTLKYKVNKLKSKDKGNTLFQKNFPGGTLVMTGANSAAGLRSMPARNLFLDEVDNYPLSSDNEGSPIDLAKARTRAFNNRKIYICSTPTNKETSVIEPMFLETDQRYYFLACPYCEHEQHLVFEQLVWTKSDYSNTKYKCVKCEELIEERYKTQMLSKGKWIATHPENTSKKKYGYHLNSLYSPLGWYSWGDFTSDWDKATMKNDLNMQKVLTNTVLGKTYEEFGEKPDWEKLYNSRHDYKIGTVPEEVCFLTCGVDVQKDRLEMEVVGWCPSRISYSIDYIVLIGETSDVKVWGLLDEIIQRQWHTSDGLKMKISRTAIDSGYNTSHVYDFCRKYNVRQVIPIKGSDSLNLPISRPSKIDRSENGKAIGYIHLWQVGSSYLKTEVYGDLKHSIDIDTGEIPYGYCYFPQYQASFFKGLTSEKYIETNNTSGYKVYQWKKDYERNEPLDCRVYAKAVASYMGYDRMDDDEILKLRDKIKPQAKIRKKNKKNTWLSK